MEKKTKKLFKRIIKAVAPPSKLTVSEWADNNRKLSSEASAEAGQWRTDRAPYQREIMDAITEPDIEKVVVMSSSQVGKTEIILNAMGYHIDLDPGPILLIQPTENLAKDFSKERVAPMIRDTACLTKKVADIKSRDTNNTILKKVFPGGLLTMLGANSPAGLAGKPIRFLFCDEIDRYPVSAGSEGDPLLLAERRTSNFWNRKKIFVSTPTIKGVSRIEDEYEKGTQERWCYRCPACGDYQYINLYGMKFDYEKDHKGNYTVWNIVFQCSGCLESFEELVWKSREGMWIAHNSEAKKIRSFQLNAFVSPWCSWDTIIKEWLEVKKDPEKYKVFKNTMLGESWEEKGEIENEDILLQRREEYPAELPAGVLLLTAGVDVQDDRLEYEVVGWGHGYESWGIEYGYIMGSPSEKTTWDMLTDKLQKVYRFEDNRGLIVACTCIDSGGHYTSEVYQYCKGNEHKRVFAIKGQGGPGLPLVYKITRTKKENCALFILGVDAGKTRVMGRIKIKEPGEGYCHYPLQESKGYERIYFKGLISERLVRRKVKGQIRLAWEKVSDHARNEPFDLRNYAMAAAEILNPSFEALEKRINNGQNLAQELTKNEQKTAKKRRGVVRKGEEF